MADKVRDVHDLMKNEEVLPDDQFLSPKDKENLAYSEKTFTVIDINLDESKRWGQRWTFDIELDGEPVRFQLGAETRNGKFISSLAEAVKVGPISGLRLVALPGTGDNAFVKIEAA